MRILLLTLTALFLMANSCETKKMLKHVDKSTKIQCFAINEYPTRPSVQSANKTYILDYEVGTEVNLSETQQTNLKNYFLNTENYSTKLARTCPFFGQYALVFLNNSERKEIILGKKQCPKALVNGKKEAFNIDFSDKTLWTILAE